MRELIFLLVVVGAVAAVWFFRQGRVNSAGQETTAETEKHAEKKEAAVAEAPVAGSSVAQSTPAKAAAKKPAKATATTKTTTKAKKEKPAAAAQVSESAGDWPAEIADRITELAQESDAVLRHRLFSQLTEATYKKRKEPIFRAACKQLSQQHIEAFSDIAKPLKKSNGGKLPHVPTFQNYANLLLEDGQFDDAVHVCEKALEFGLDDKTQTGFQGRIDRIRAKQAKA